MSTVLNNKTVAILATDGFEESELISPLEFLKKNGAKTYLISNKKGSIKSWKDNNWNREFEVDLTLDETDAVSYDALLLPGGVMNPDQLRIDEQAISFIRSFFERGKPVAAICHGPQMLIEADVLQGREMTSYPSIKTDLKNAGAKWIDNEVVVDMGLVTSRSPADLDAFNAKVIEEFAEGKHEKQMTA